MQTLTKDWRNELKMPEPTIQLVEVPPLDVCVHVHPPFTAAETSRIAAGFEVDDEGQFVDADAYFAAYMAKAICDEAGGPIFAAKDLAEMPSPKFWAFWRAVSSAHGLRGEKPKPENPEKNSPPASGSPAGSP